MKAVLHSLTFQAELGMDEIDPSMLTARPQDWVPEPIDEEEEYYEEEWIEEKEGVYLACRVEDPLFTLQMNMMLRNTIEKIMKYPRILGWLWRRCTTGAVS